MNARRLALVATLFASIFSQAQKSPLPVRKPEPKPWNFVVSGDSRNCGDIVMPAIASGAKNESAQFYWHLGDFRAIFAMDEDILERKHEPHPASLEEYQKKAWQDAMGNQLMPFGNIPVFVGIGNHETIPPKSRGEFVEAFKTWLDAPVLRNQRLKDNPNDRTVKTYYHWQNQAVEFIYVDNASSDEFDHGQVEWFERVLDASKNNASVKTVVVGMHAALPNSLAAGHSMNNWKRGEESGLRVYNDLLKFRDETHKNVYVLASHSHFYMKGTFETEYWKSHGGVLPGWIVGTAGAHRYRLPEDANKATEARTHVYGYLVGNVKPDGVIDFNFREIKETQVPKETAERFGHSLIRHCFEGNADTK